MSNIENIIRASERVNNMTANDVYINGHGWGNFSPAEAMMKDMLTV